MALSIGIVGLPNVGKSTLFNALTKQSVPAENYPFCTIDPCVGVIEVPDERLEKLAHLSGSQKILPATVSFVDIAGLVKGAAQGEGLGNTFLSHIRQTDALLHMLRCFEDPAVLHVDGAVNPHRDREVIEAELLLADLALAEKRLSTLEKAAKRGEKEAQREKVFLERVIPALKSGKPVSSIEREQDEDLFIRDLGFLTEKPVLYVCNVDETGGQQTVASLRETLGTPVLTIAAHSEQALTEMSADERALLREGGDGIEAIIQQAYATLGLISFFTTGEKETRAWTVPEGVSAKRAARAIHTDFEKHFIRAEVIASDVLCEYGSYAQARKHGAVRLEGKEYIVADGDVILFRVGV